MQSILLIDHGSRRAEANEMLACMANLVQQMVGDAVVVEHAHMELAAPDIAAGFARCVARGATEVVAFPYMLSPGKHATADIPRLVAEAASAHDGIEWRVTAAFGVHEQVAEVILLRAGIAPARRLTAAEACRCWHPSHSGTACGEACRANPQACAATEAAELRRAPAGADGPPLQPARAAP